MDKVRLILWKNVRLRLYHPLLTLAEICFPMLVFYHGILIYHAFQVHPNNGTLYPILTEPQLYSMFQSAHLIIAYAPKTPFTTEIMNKTIQKFAPYRAISADELLPFEDETQTEMFFSNRTYFQQQNGGQGWLAFAVIFDSASTNEFRYKIRTSKEVLRNKDTRYLYPKEYNVPDLTIEDDYIKCGFIALEYSLNMAFISLKSGDSIFPTISMQQFPYPWLNGDRSPEETVYTLALIGFVFLTLAVPHYIASERQSGMKELMKAAGIPEWLLWFGWITYSLMIYPIIITAVTIVLTSHSVSVPFYENVSCWLVWTVLMLYCVAVLTFLFAVGTLFGTKHWIAVTVGVITWFVTSSKCIISIAGDVGDEKTRLLALPLLFLLPNLVLYNAFKTLEYFEFKGYPTSVSTFLAEYDDPNILHIRYILFLFIINIILNGCIIFYVSAVHPGRYGRKKNIFFLFKKIVPYFGKKVDQLKNDEPNADNDFFEKFSPDAKIAFSVYHVQKKFGLFQQSAALVDVNLDIKEGDITVLIGHNGAGKTTLLNVLTGMISETSGTVLYKNQDITINRKTMREDIGYCPQQNVFFPYLTIVEHLLFFTMIKGHSEYRAQSLVQSFLKTLRMEEDGSKYVQQLSAGAKRKLSLALALINYPKILILDEPTLGMDLISRRRTWALLKKIKSNRVILVTTQDMEEADLLGDRIAVMHNGQVFCYGSGLFLKTIFGTGYSMILSKGEKFDTRTVTEIVESELPKATLQKETDNYVLYKLPVQQKNNFPQLFRTLESQKERLDITDIEVEYSTMEQLFMNVHHLAAKKDHARKTMSSPGFNLKEISTGRKTGYQLILSQMKALLSTRMKINKRRYNRMFACVLAAVILGILNVKVIDWSYTLLFDKTANPPLKLTLKTYKNVEVITSFNVDHNTDPSLLVSRLERAYKKYVHSQRGVVRVIRYSTDHQIEKTLSDLNSRNPYKYVTAIVAQNDSSVLVLYNGLILHGAPIAVNTYTNALMHAISAENKNFSMSVISHSLVSPATQTFCSIDMESSFLTAATWWIFIFYSAVMCLLASYVAFMVVERMYGMQHLQTMSYLNGITYWVGNFVFDYFYFVIIMVIFVATMKLADSYQIFGRQELEAWLAILLLFGISGIMYSYLFGRIVDTISVFLFINIPIIICIALGSIVFQTQGVSNFLIRFEPFFAVVPSFTFFNLVIRFLFVMINNNHCKYCLAWELSKCEHNTVKLKYFGFNNYDEYAKFNTGNLNMGRIMQTQIYELMIYSVAQAIIYIFLLTMVNSPFGKRLWNSFMTRILGKQAKYEIGDISDPDTNVEDERRSVEELSLHTELNPKNVLIVRGLKKNILYGFGKFSPIKDLSFMVSINQCFGLVGGNGAGKSTAFKILSANMVPTAGDAIFDRISMMKDRRNYLSLIGYCPQTNAIYDELTAREMLHFFATLRGLEDPQVHVDKWISVLGLEHYKNRIIDSYSSGTKRKVCIGLSMIGYPLVIYLDEPSAGIDPSSRRKIYRAIKWAKRSNHVVVIASHDLKECEDLCDRVAVIQAGLLQRVGTVSELKQMYAAGYTLIVKLYTIFDYDNQTDSLISDIIATFGPSCQLKDRRLGLFHFVIIDSRIQWSQLFSGMEEVKSKYPVIDEYILSNSTVDEIMFPSTVRTSAIT